MADLAITDAAATAILGPKCPQCGWRRGWHRGPLAGQDPCPHYDPDNPRPEQP